MIRDSFVGVYDKPHITGQFIFSLLMFFLETHHGANLEGGQQDTMNNSLKHKHPADFSPVETTQFDPEKPWRVTFYNQRNFGHVFFYIVHHPQNKGHVFFSQNHLGYMFFSCPQCYFWLP